MCSKLASSCMLSLYVLEVSAVHSSVIISFRQVCNLKKQLSHCRRTDSRQQPSLFYVHTKVLRTAKVIVLALLAT